MIEPGGPESPPTAPAAARPAITPGALIASVLAAAIVGGVVATGVTLGILHQQSRTNPQRVDLSSGVTIREEDATMQVAQKAAPAVVSIVTHPATMGHGAGFLVTSDGYVVTNIGVVANAQTLAVLISGDARAHDARLVDYDCGTGLAVLKVDGVSNLPTLTFDSASTLAPGQIVVLVGGPVPDPGATTRAVVSALHAMVTVDAAAGGGPAIQMSDLIRTDVGIDPGVSGGPLLNVGGHVVGVAMAATSQGRATGLAIPAGDVQPEVEEIVQGSGLIVPSLGAQTLDVSVDTAAIQNSVAGAQITAVDGGGPAALAGLRPGDVITQLDDQRLDDAHPLGQMLRARFRPAQRVTVSYVRAGSSGQVQLTLLGAHPACR